MAIASIAMDHFLSRGLTLTSRPGPVELTLEESGIAARIAAGRQPGGAKYPRLIPEFREVITVEIPTGMATELGVEKGAPLRKRACEVLKCPEYTKVIATKGGKEGPILVDLGIPHTIPEFNRLAVELSHPFDTSGLFHQDLSHALFELLTLGPAQVRAKREKRFRHYMRRAADLAKRELKLKEGLQKRAASWQRSGFFFSERCAEMRGWRTRSCSISCLTASPY